MKIALALTILSLLTAIFAMWFFPLNGVALLGSILGTGFVVMGSLFAIISYLLHKESF